MLQIHQTGMAIGEQLQVRMFLQINHLQIHQLEIIITIAQKQ